MGERSLEKKPYEKKLYGNFPLPVTRETINTSPNGPLDDDHSFHAEFTSTYFISPAFVAWSEEQQAYVAQFPISNVEIIPMVLGSDRIEAQMVFENIKQQMSPAYGEFDIQRLKQKATTFQGDYFTEAVQHKKTEEKFRKLYTMACEQMRRWIETNPPIEELRYAINQWLRAGEFAYNEHILKALQKLKNPIVVDFNGVIANNDSSQWNPEATMMLEKLAKIGEIVIVTVAKDRKTSGGSTQLQDFLSQHGWGPNRLIFMTRTNYMGTDDRYADELRKRQRTQQEKIIQQYLQNHSEVQAQVSDFLDTGPDKKHIAPLFDSPRAPVIIDDSATATHENPGMNGIWVKSWTTDEQPDWFTTTTENEGALSLENAVKIVEEYYPKSQTD